MAGRKNRAGPFAGTIIEPHGDIRASILFYRPDVEQTTDVVDFDRMRQGPWSRSMPVHAHQFRPFGRPTHEQRIYAFVGVTPWMGRSLSETLLLVKKSFSGSGGPLGVAHCYQHGQVECADVA